MASPLAALSLLITCPRCGRAAWCAQNTGTEGTLVCASCAAAYPWRDGVLDLGGVNEEPAIVHEREGVRRTERNAALGGINDEFDDLSRAQGALKDAILALPYGNGSRYYAEPGYFANVQATVPAFDFLVRYLDLRAGERLLDLGADLTWSTSHMARRGLDCCAVDINHHLSVARLFEERFGVSYHCVRANMRDVPFREGTFDVILAMNALHHASPIESVAANIARMLKQRGRLAFSEPYSATDEAKAAFGRAQINEGISERTYLLQEWHQAFVDAGFRIRTVRVADSFAAIYEHAAGGSPDLFAGFYDGALSVIDAPPNVAAGSVFHVTIAVDNRGNGVWTSVSQFPVHASYHLHRGAGDAALSFDNVRTPLPVEVGPGERATLAVKVTAPNEPGDYVAEIDLVHESLRWFASKGMVSRRVEFRVSAA